MKNKSEEWKGYTMQELQLHRAINKIRLEVEKEKLAQRFDSFRSGAVGSVSSFLLNNLGTFSKSLGIATTAFTIFRKGYKLIKGK